MDETDMSDINDIISKLKFLSKVQKNQKINVSGMFVQLVGTVTSVQRFMQSESRTNTLNFIDKIIKGGINIIDKYNSRMTASQKLTISNIIEDLHSVKDGLRNLRHTYSDDIMFGSNIDTYMQLIDVKLRDVKDKYPELFTNKEDLLSNASEMTMTTDDDD